MRTIIRRSLLILTAVVLTAVSAATSDPAVARLPAFVTGQPAVIDGIVFAHLPAGLGTASDFTYDYDDVDFQARVWESATEEGWQVDLDIDVMRGARLTDGPALHDWFIAYEDRDPEQAVYRPVRVHGRPGWLCRDQLFWLVRPGLAASVHLDRSRWSRREVVRTAWSARERR